MGIAKRFFLENKRWFKLGFFFIACTFGVAGIFLNQLELVVIASLFMGCSFWHFQENSSEENRTLASGKHEISSDRAVLTTTLLIYAILIGIGVVYLSKNPEFGQISLILWIISITLIISAGIVFDRLNPFNWIKRIKNLSPIVRRNLLIEIALVSLITGIALVLRVTHLDLYPPMMHGDEGEAGMEALRVLGVGDPITPFGSGWGNLPNLFFYLQAGSIFVFGRNEIALRMVPALFGTSCVPLVYLIGRKFWGKLAGFTGAWLIAVSQININFSRLGVTCIESAFFTILFIFLVLISQSNNVSNLDQEPRKPDAINMLKDKFIITPYIAMGLTCGLAQYIGIYSWLIPVIALPLFIILFIRKRINIIQIGIVGLTAVLVFAPLGFYYFQSRNIFTDRAQTVSIINPDSIRNNYGQNATLSNSLFLIIQNQIKNNLNFFLQSGDTSSFYDQNIPGFDFITALLFWFGLGVVFSRPRRFPEMALIIWFVIGIVLGGVITNNAPSGTRLLIVTSAIFIMGGIFMQRTWDVLNETFKKIPNVNLSLAWLSGPMLFGIMIATLGINMNYFFVVYPKAGLNLESIAIAKEIILDAPVDHIYLLGDGDIYVSHGTIRFLAGVGKATDLKQLKDLPPLIRDGKGITVLASYSHFDEVNSLKSRYPLGVISNGYYFGKLVFMKYRIPPINSP